MSTKKQTIGSKVLSLATALSIFGVTLLPEGTFYNNLELIVHVFVWAVLVLGLLAIFVVDQKDIPKTSLWWSIPLTILWGVALAFANWSNALILYVIFSIFAYAKRSAANE